MRSNQSQDQTAASSAAASAGLGEPTITIAGLAEEFGVTLRTLRFYEARGFLFPQRTGPARRYTQEDRNRVAFILQAKRLGFTLREAGDMIAAPEHDPDRLQLSRQQCTEQINLLERQKRAIETALAELRQVYSSHYLHALARAKDEGA